MLFAGLAHGAWPFTRPQEPKATESSGQQHGVLLVSMSKDGTYHDVFVMSLLRTLDHFNDKKRVPGWKANYAFINAVTDIVRSRNYALKLLLDDPKYQALVMIDNDHPFEPEMVQRFLESGREVVSAACPAKNIQWERSFKAARLGYNDAWAQAAAMNVEMNFFGREDTDVAAPYGPPGSFYENSKIPKSRDGFVKVKRAGTGFLMLRRSAVEKMVQAYPETQHQDLIGETVYGLFEFSMITSEGIKYRMSEDFTFSDRWRALGGDIWVDARGGLDHKGYFTFPLKKWLWPEEDWNVPIEEWETMSEAERNAYQEKINANYTFPHRPIPASV